MGNGLDTDWAEAKDSREDELSRLRRLGSSVESKNKENRRDNCEKKIEDNLTLIRDIPHEKTNKQRKIYQTVPAETGEQSVKCGGWPACLSSALLLLGLPHISQTLHTEEKNTFIQPVCTFDSRGTDPHVCGFMCTKMFSH